MSEHGGPSSAPKPAVPVADRLDRIEAILEQLQLRQFVDGETLDHLDRAVRFLDEKADQTAHNQVDLAEALVTLASEPDEPEPVSRPCLSLASPAA